MTALSEDVAGYLSEDIVQGKLQAFQTKLQLEQVSNIYPLHLSLTYIPYDEKQPVSPPLYLTHFSWFI